MTQVIYTNSTGSRPGAPAVLRPYNRIVRNACSSPQTLCHAGFGGFWCVQSEVEPRLHGLSDDQ
jgi:hypothetical protein